MSHGGSTNGQYAGFTMVPAHRFAVVSLTNAEPNGPLFNRRIRDWALEAFLGLVEDEPVPEPRSAGELEPYAGRYETVASLIDVVGRRRPPVHGRRRPPRSSSRSSEKMPITASRRFRCACFPARIATSSPTDHTMASAASSCAIRDQAPSPGSTSTADTPRAPIRSPDSARDRPARRHRPRAPRSEPPPHREPGRAWGNRGIGPRRPTPRARGETQRLPLVEKGALTLFRQLEHGPRQQISHEA